MDLDFEAAASRLGKEREARRSAAKARRMAAARRKAAAEKAKKAFKERVKTLPPPPSPVRAMPRRSLSLLQRTLNHAILSRSGNGSYPFLRVL